MTNSKRTPAKIEYVPPPFSEVKAFAQAVCNGLAEKTKNTDFTKTETVQGFAEFLLVLLTIEAKRRNAAQFDSAN